MTTDAAVMNQSIAGIGQLSGRVWMAEAALSVQGDRAGVVMQGQGVGMAVEIAAMAGDTVVLRPIFRHHVASGNGGKGVITTGGAGMTGSAVGLMGAHHHIKVIMASGYVTTAAVIDHIVEAQVIHMQLGLLFIHMAVKAVGRISASSNHRINCGADRGIWIDVSGGKVTGAARAFWSAAQGELIVL